LSYTAVAVLVPASVSQGLLVSASLWAGAVVVAYAAWTRHEGRPAGSEWAFPVTWWSVQLAAAAVAAVVFAILLPPAGRSHADLLRITIVGVIGEEALFRGLLGDVMQSMRHREGRWPDAATLALTSVLFAIAHVQYDGFRMTLALADQVGYTLAAGLVLGWARGSSGSITPPILLHALGNAGLKLAAMLGRTGAGAARHPEDRETRAEVAPVVSGFAPLTWHFARPARSAF